MLLYSLLHLSGYDLPLEELKNFRQLHSKKPRPPGDWLYAVGGNHHRAAGTGFSQRRWAGHRERTVRSLTSRGMTSSITTRTSLGDGCLMEDLP